MKARWMTLDPGSDERQEKWFEGWIAGKNISFQSPEAEARYRERAGMIKDAVQMKKIPKRVPVSPSTGYFPLEYSGVNYYEMMYDQAVLIKAWRKYYDDFDPDIFRGPVGMAGRVFELLDFKMYRWPGHGLPEDREFQYVEREYMAADEYQDLIDDPTGWFMTVYFPRIFGSLKIFDMIPILPNINEMPMVMPAVTPFGRPDLQEAFKRLMEAGEAAVEWGRGIRRFNAAIIGQGYPPMGGKLCEGPL